MDGHDTPTPGAVATSTIDPIMAGSAAIGLITAYASGQVGFSHAKSIYDAFNGGTAGFDDYLTVATAYWHALPIGCIFAVFAWLVARGTPISGPMLRNLAGLVGIPAAMVGAFVDAPKSIEALYAMEHAHGSDSVSILTALGAVYGPLAATLATIAGMSVGVLAARLERSS